MPKKNKGKNAQNTDDWGDSELTDKMQELKTGAGSSSTNHDFHVPYFVTHVRGIILTYEIYVT